MSPRSIQRPVRRWFVPHPLPVSQEAGSWRLEVSPATRRKLSKKDLTLLFPSALLVVMQTNQTSQAGERTQIPTVFYYGSCGWDFTWTSDLSIITKNGNQPAARMEANSDGFRVFNDGYYIGTRPTYLEAVQLHRDHCAALNF